MINIYTASEAKSAADTFYGPLSQIFDFIRTKSQDGLYVLQIRGVELNPKQLDVLLKNGYSVEQTTDEQNTIMYIVGWA